MHPETHAYIVRKAISLAGIPEIKENADLIVQGCIREDFRNVLGIDLRLGVLTHFYCPIKNKGLWFFKSAKKRGIDLYYKAAKLHISGETEKAYETLGRCTHLLADMAVPAHTQLIKHYCGDAFEQCVAKARSINPKIHATKEERNWGVGQYFFNLAILSRTFETFKPKELENNIHEITRQIKLQ